MNKFFILFKYHEYITNIVIYIIIIIININVQLIPLFHITLFIYYIELIN